MHIREGDTVHVISGNSRETQARVLKVLPKRNKLVVEGVNLVYKHVRRSQRNPQGGRLSKEMPIDQSIVKLVCTSCGKPSRTGARYLDDGAKERYCKKCGAGQGQISPPHKSHAKK